MPALRKAALAAAKRQGGAAHWASAGGGCGGSPNALGSTLPINRARMRAVGSLIAAVACDTFADAGLAGVGAS
jgi:hypothetical protein